MNKFTIIYLIGTLTTISTFGFTAVYIDHRADNDVVRVSEELLLLRSEISEVHDKRIILMKVLVMHPKIDVELAHSISEAIYIEAQSFKIDPSLVLAIIEIESNFRADARSGKNAVGLMQVLEKWSKPPHKQCDLQEPACNIHHGIRLLHTYMEMYGSIDTALTVYNRGPSAVDLAQNAELDPTNGYEFKVLKVYEYLKRL